MNKASGESKTTPPSIGEIGPRDRLAQRYRNLLQGAVLGGVLSCVPLLGLTTQAAATEAPAVVAEQTVSLKQAFAGQFSMGAAVSKAQILGEQPGALALVAEQFNTLTAENDMKWERIQPLEGEFDWSVADRFAEFAQRHEMELVGHVLLWHSQTPDWVFEDGAGNPASRERLYARLETHINALAGRYAGQVFAWDVVNEALNEDGSLRDSPWRKILGDDYIIEAFRMAHAADPAAKLVYNDYNLFKPGKRAGVVRLVKQIQAAGVPIHAVGLQGHYSLGYPEDLNEVRDSIRAFSALGLEVMITELDISVLPFPEEAEQGADITQDLALNQRLNPYAAGLPDAVASAQADHYANLFGIFLEHADVVSRVTFWGIGDAHSWRNSWPMADRTDYPLLFDRSLQPKAVNQRLSEMAEALP